MKRRQLFLHPYFNRLREQLLEAGLPEAEAEGNALLWQARGEASVELWNRENPGDLMTLESWAQRYPVDVVREISDPARREVLRQQVSEMLSQFAGPKARTANLTMLKLAKASIAKGADPEEVRQQTGWHQGVDGRWRFEIDDSQARTQVGFKRVGDWFAEKSMPWPLLGEIMVHPALYEAYPELAEIEVEPDPLRTHGANVEWLGDRYRILVGHQEIMSDLLDRLLHEIQHVIQEVEGYAGGGDPRDAFADPRVRPGATRGTLKAAQQILSELIANASRPMTLEEYATEAWGRPEADADVQSAYVEYRQVVEAAGTSKMVVAAAQEAAAREWYKRLAGEVEARNTPRRRKLTAEDRRQQSPESTEDVPREQQIVRFARARAMDLGDARFSVASLQRAINAGVDSSDMMIYVSPEWFLNLSGAAEPDKTADAAEVLARDERLRDLPHLELEFEGEQARVVGHEGRHRVAALQALGLELIPVVLYAEGVSWGRQAESASPSRLEAWPKELIGTNGEAVSFPVSREAWLQSPAARTVSPADRDAAFRRLFGKSLVVDENGKPLRVFRGEHGGLEGVQRYQNLVGGLSFGTPAAANSYALHPNDRRFQVEASRVMPAYLRIENPVFNNPDDPFIELSDLAEKLGAEEAVRIGKKFAEAIEDTSSWQDDLSNEFESPVEFLDKNPERLGDLYFSAFRLLDDHEEIERFKAAGFDGAIHMGNGVTFNEAEYRVFDASQVISAIEFVPEGAPPVVLNRSWLDGDDAIDWSSDQMLSQTATTLSGSERQSNFQRWFGESLMRNEDGSPMDFYHGTGGDFEVFSKELRGSQTSAADAERGFFFTTSPQAAGEFAWKDGERGSIMPVYLRVTNPYLTDFVVTPANQREFAKIIDEARSLGHDGVACFLDTFGHESGLCVVFEAEQIKSSLGNDGTFDLEDPSVLSQFAGRKAITADEGALMQAVAMIEAGFMPELIRQETGWFLGHDDEWRFEIDDSAAEMILWGEPSVQALRDANGGEWITPEQFVEKYPEHELSARIQKWAKIREVDTVIQGQKIGVLTVGDVLRHDKLFKAYPWVAEISLVIDDTMRIGSAVYSDDEFGYVRCIVMGPVANPDVALRILSHEIQHGIQGYEGFARGGMIESDGVRIAAREGRGRRVGSSDEIRELRRELELLRREYSRKNGMKRYKGQTAELRENLARDADLVKKIEDLSSPVITREDALNAYRRIAGEVEARNVERRLKFSSEIRAETPPQVTEDIDADRIILLDAAGDPISGFVMSGRDEQVGETAALFDFSRDGEQWRTVKVGDTRVIYGFDGDRLEVASLRTPQAKRGKGSARRAMEALLTEADAQGITVKLGASPLDSRTREAKLQAFYRSLGFEYTGRNYNPAGDPEMVRLPRVSSPVVVRVFHGTDEKVTVFDTAASNDLERKRLGAYFSTSQAFASLYGTNLVSADLTLAKPFDITGLSAEGAIERLPVSSRLKCELRMAFRGFDYSQYGLLETAQREDLRSALEAAGYDGIKYTEGYADAYVAFKPEQIRIIDEPRPEPAPHDADFQKWFGASRIVDESGQAKVVYHGTRLGGFSSFRPNYRKGEQLGFGIHFAESESFARLYAEDDRVARKGKQPEVYAVFLSMQNPLRANSLVHEGSPEFDLGLKLGGKKVYVSKDEKGNRCLYMQHAIDATSPARAEKLIRESGYDGVIYDAQVGTYGVVNRTLAKSESYIVFEPGQIKSATDNDGSFDRDDESILSQSAELPSTAVREAQFNAWFAGSSVIDGQGRPLVVYHGTDADENFDIFSQTSDVGFHFGSLAAAQARLDQGEAGEGARILPVYLSIKNPLRLPDLHTWSTGWVVSALVEAGVLTEEQAEAILESGYFDEVQFAAALEAKGYDGVVYHNETEGGGDSWIALRAEQIKSAVGNDGSFDRDDESILSQSSALPEDLLLEVVPHIGESLTDEQRRNEELGFNRYGAPYRFGPMTASWSRQVLVPVEVLKHLKGALGEQQSVRQDDLDSLLDYMGRHRQLPPASFGAVDQHAAPYIEVWQDGSAWINEGNHRIMAAAQLGAQYLPVDIRYFAGAEAVSGPLSPALIKEYDAQARAAGLSLTRYFAAAPASLAKPLLGDEREANLRTWLGDSKIVDADGNPTVLYHGTGGVIDRFDRSRIGSASDAGNASTGAFWLTDMPDVAADFAVMQNDATVMPVYVRMSHPLVVDCAAYARRHLCANQAMRLDNGELIYDINPFKEAALRDARIGGYDGLVFEGGYDEFPRPGRIFAVFQPDQLKSALGNDGSFDRDDESILSQFAGARAENASLVDLEKARVLVEAGADPEQVRKDTGWFKSVDGKWRFEIDDSQCTLRSGSGLNVWEGPVRLADLIDHPQLFNAYPHLEWLDVELTLEGPSGAFNESWNKISILAEDLDQEGLTPKQMKVLLHEIQHAIQAHEGFAAGGDYRDFIDTEELTAREQYFYLAGEAEARNTVRRRALTEAERLEHSPASTADVPVDRQIVRWNGVPMHSASIESAAGLPPEVVGDVRVVEDVRGAHHGQLDVTLRVLVNDEEVGTLDYSRFGGKPYINMIHVAPQARRRGYAQRMVQELQRQYPGEEIQWGLLSEEGAKLFAAMPKVEVGTEFKPLFEQLDRMKAECDRHMAVVAQFRDTPMPSTELRSGYEAALAVLNDLHSDISSLEFTLENEKRTITLIRTDVPEALEVLSQFAGQKARTADLGRLSLAKAGIASGLDAELVRQETGWHKGLDGHWRFEIDDSGAFLLSELFGRQVKAARRLDAADAEFQALEEELRKRISSGELSEVVAQELLEEGRAAVMAVRDEVDPIIGIVEYPARPLAVGVTMPLREVLYHPALFEAYPELAEMPVNGVSRAEGGTLQGWFDGRTLNVVVEKITSDELLETLSHEIQHAVQEIEQFAPGGTAAYFKDISLVEELTRPINARLNELLNSDPEFGSLKRQQHRTFAALQSAYGEDTERGRKLDWEKVPVEKHDAYMDLLDLLAGYEQYWEYNELETKRFYIERDQPVLTAHEQYRRLVGEVEARNTESRRLLSTAERRATSPVATEDVPAVEQKVAAPGHRPRVASVEELRITIGTVPDSGDFGADTKLYLAEMLPESFTVYRAIWLAEGEEPRLDSPGSYWAETPEGARRSGFGPADGKHRLCLLEADARRDDINVWASTARRRRYGEPEIVFNEGPSSPRIYESPVEIEPGLTMAQASPYHPEFPPLPPVQRRLPLGWPAEAAEGVDSLAFKDWFGASKAVDQNGRPLVLFHGTRRDVEAFDAQEARKTGRPMVPDSTFYFTDSAGVASSYAGLREDMTGRLQQLEGGNVMPVYLSLQRPMVVNARGANWDDIFWDGDYWSTNDLAVRARLAGHDGLIIRNVKDVGAGQSVPANNYVVFSSEQVKSAIGNDGSYDRDDASILSQFAGRQAANADLARLDVAVAALLAGEDAEVVRQQTGWHKGPDGQWRFEIDDSTAGLDKGFFDLVRGERSEVPLDQVLMHPALFDAYPDLRNISVSMADLGNSNAVLVGLEHLLLSYGMAAEQGWHSFLQALLHEVQHAIQDLEGFAIGGSPRDKSLPSREALAGAINAEYSARAEAIERSEAYQAFVQVELAKVPEDQRYREGRNGLYDYGLSLAKQSAWSRFIEPVEVERNARLTELFAIGGLFPRENEIAYRLLAGEAEARNTVARMELAAAQRQSIAPVATLDVPADWLIVRSREEGRALVSASEPLDLLPSMLLPRGDNPAIGEEQGTVRRDGISTFRSPHGSTRYVLSRNGVAIAALQVVSRDGRHALVANIYTHPDHRRQGLATKLLVKARQDFARVDISDDLTVDGKAWVLGLEDDGQSLSQTASVEDRAPAMLALHNLNEVKLRFADRLGGLAAPSIAVITEERGELKEFGEITLIGTREMADPQQVPVFDADAYTLRFPDPQYGKAKQAGLDRLCRQVREISKEFHDGSLEMETLNAAENNDLQRILRLWGQSDAVKALFLREQGFEVMPVMRGKHLPGMVTREHMQPLIPLIDAIDRDRPMGEQMSSEAFGLLRDAYVLAVRASHPDAFDGSETQEVVDAYCNFDRGPYLALRQAAEMVRTGGVEEFDRSGTRTLIKGIFAERGLVHAFDTWLGARWEGVFGDPFLKVGRSRVPYDLENITEAMISGQVHGQEETLVFGPGNARAHAAHRFTSFEEMHAFATGSLGSVAEVEAARKEGEQHLDAFREKVWRYHKSTNYRGEVSVWDANSDALRALSKLVKARTKDVATLRSLLSKSDFAVGSLPAEVLELGLKAYDELMSSPVPYFEAKPQRAVTLGEFAGAVIPQDAAPEVREILARHGLAVREYPAGDAEARHEAILKHARELAVARPDVLFGRIEPELTIVSETAARQQAFEAWFGQSVLRTSTGEPLVLYHGTHASFDRFDSFKQGTISDAGWYGAGFYFSPLASEANKYAREDGASVMPVYVRIERPYYWHDENERGLIQNYGPASQEKTAELKTAGYDGVIVAKDYYSFANGMSDESWQLLIEASPVLANIGRERLPQLLASNEYPYAKLRDMYGKAFVDSLTPVRTEIVEVVAFEDTQIKSAIGNDGSYDRNDPSILSQSEGQRASGVRFFSTAALEQAAGAEGRLVLMHPADFLALAAPEYPEEDKALVLRELLEQGGQIDAVPVLTLRSNSDGGTQVDIHDGRHRARELLRRGVEVMPVLLNGVEPAEKIRGQGDNYRNEVVTPAPALGSQSSNEVGGPSILSQSAALPVILERQLNLLRWLGSNPLLNDAGEPLVLYHGTRSAEGLDRFIPGGPAGAEQTGDAYGVASYFTTNPLEASVYGTEGAVLPVYVRGKLLDVELPELSVADAERLTAFANAILLPSDKARFPMGRAERRFSAEELEDAKDFFESCRANWEQFGDKMERAKPEVDKDGDIFIVRYTDFDAPVAIRTGDDAFTLFSAVGWDNLPAAGFDGLVMARENGQKWVVMHRPEGNVKSALGNNGQFSELDARILHQFAGEKARTANLDRLIRARMQVAAGDSPEKVRLETGWHQGADEQWRFEIDDSLARVKPDGLALLRQARQPADSTVIWPPIP